MTETEMHSPLCGCPHFNLNSYRKVSNYRPTTQVIQTVQTILSQSTPVKAKHIILDYFGIKRECTGRINKQQHGNVNRIICNILFKINRNQFAVNCTVYILSDGVKM